MARRMFGGTGVVLNEATGQPLVGLAMAVSRDEAGLDRVSDVTGPNGQDIGGVITTLDHGKIPVFLGPADDTAEVWINTGATTFMLEATDTTERLASLEAWRLTTSEVLRPRGDYLAGIVYRVNDIFRSDGSTFRVIREFTAAAGGAPGAYDPATGDFQPFVTKGDPGWSPVPTGPFQANHAYLYGDLFTAGGNLFFVKNLAGWTSDATAPTSSGTNVEIWASRGEAGPAGTGGGTVPNNLLRSLVQAANGTWPNRSSLTPAPAAGEIIVWQFREGATGTGATTPPSLGGEGMGTFDLLVKPDAA